MPVGSCRAGRRFPLLLEVPERGVSLPVSTAQVQALRRLPQPVSAGLLAAALRSPQTLGPHTVSCCPDPCQKLQGLPAALLGLGCAAGQPELSCGSRCAGHCMASTCTALQQGWGTIPLICVGQLRSRQHLTTWHAHGRIHRRQDRANSPPQPSQRSGRPSHQRP